MSANPETTPHLAVAEDRSSPKAQLLAKRRQAAGEHTVDVPVQGYEGLLVARYRLLDPLGEGKILTEKIYREFKTEEERNFWGAVESLIASIEGFYFRTDEGKLVAIEPSDGQGPMGYDHRLAAYFEFEAESARDSVKGLFNGENLWVLAHAMQMSKMMALPGSTGALGEA